MGRKTSTWTLQVTNKRNLFQKKKKNSTRLKKINLKKETESLMIAAQNNTVRNNYVKTKSEKTQQSSRCRLFGDRDEPINLIISECSKLAQKSIRRNTTEWAR